MSIFKRIQTATSDLAVRSAEQMRRPPKFKLLRAVTLLLAALYISYYVRLTGGGDLARVASLFLVVIPTVEVMTQFTRYLYLRGHRTARSIPGKLLK